MTIKTMMWKKKKMKMIQQRNKIWVKSLFFYLLLFAGGDSVGFHFAFSSLYFFHYNLRSISICYKNMKYNKNLSS